MGVGVPCSRGARNAGGIAAIDTPQGDIYIFATTIPGVACNGPVGSLKWTRTDPETGGDSRRGGHERGQISVLSPELCPETPPTGQERACGKFLLPVSGRADVVGRENRRPGVEQGEGACGGVERGGGRIGGEWYWWVAPACVPPPVERNFWRSLVPPPTPSSRHPPPVPVPARFTTAIR
jgi:hypothetical protein